MFIWDQSAGILYRNGKIVAKGYSGRDYGLNNPDAQNAQGIGPIPRGIWSIIGRKDNGSTGPLTLILEPQPGTDTCGRSQFRIHGDNAKLNKTASHGCIILPRHIRQLIWDSKDTVLSVIE